MEQIFFTFVASSCFSMRCLLLVFFALFFFAFVPRTCRGKQCYEKQPGLPPHLEKVLREARNESEILKQQWTGNGTAPVDPELEAALKLGVNPHEIVLNVCEPRDGFCTHCTHAGGPTSCYSLVNFGCIAVINEEKGHSIENWGFNEDAEWTQNFDLRGNTRNVRQICKDRYHALCFRLLPEEEYPSEESSAWRGPSFSIRLPALGTMVMTLVITSCWAQES